LPGASTSLPSGLRLPLTWISHTRLHRILQGSSTLPGAVPGVFFFLGRSRFPWPAAVYGSAARGMGDALCASVRRPPALSLFPGFRLFLSPRVACFRNIHKGFPPPAGGPCLV